MLTLSLHRDGPGLIHCFLSQNESFGMDIGEGRCYGECCEVCKPGDSQTCTPGANNTLYVNKHF